MYTVVKKIDDLGRIAIPKDVRRALYWAAGDEIEISVEPGQIIKMRKVNSDLSSQIEELKEAVSNYCSINSIDTTEIQNAFDLINEKLNKG